MDLEEINMFIKCTSYQKVRFKKDKNSENGKNNGKVSKVYNPSLVTDLRKFLGHALKSREAKFSDVGKTRQRKFGFSIL